MAAAAAAALVPLTPGFSARDIPAAVVAALVAAVATSALVWSTDRLGRTFGFPRSASGDATVFAVALASAVAGAIHFAAAKMHFDEYTLFGLFMVVSGIAQFAWAIWVLLRPWRPLFLLGALGNTGIVALWLMDRTSGLPLGPTAWKPDPFGLGDTVSAALEVLVVVASVALFVRNRARRGRLTPPAMTAGLATAVVLLTLSILSILGTAASVLPPSQ